LLAEERQTQALALLLDTRSIKETSINLGYKQQTNFTRKFRGIYGIPPSKRPITRPGSAGICEND
jgi:AraC-like DNA-binding protein